MRRKASVKPGSGFEHGLPTLQTGDAGLRTTRPEMTVLVSAEPVSERSRAERRPVSRARRISFASLVIQL